MPEVREEVINIKLAEILAQNFSIDARAERVKGKRRPDIRCYYKGFIIGIEASYEKSDAERDAESRIEQGLADIALALWIKERFKDIPEPELADVIRKSKFSVKVFVPREIRGTLLQFLEKGIKKKAEPVTEWFEDVDLPMLKAIIENSINFLSKEEEIQRLLEEMKSKFSDFINTLKNLDPRGEVRRRICESLYKLYGLSVAESDDPDVAFGHAALSILLSAVFYEHVRDMYPELRPIVEYVKKYGSIEGLRSALEDLLKIDYRTAVELAIEILRILPPGITERTRDLIELAIRISANKDLLKRDFAGRVYHEVTGDIALRKGFATFYTEVPAAYLLATLAVMTFLGLDEKNPLTLSREEARRLVDRLESIRVVDFACGSGTLLTASFNALMHVITMLKFYYNLEDVDLNNIGKRLIEEGIYGIDALRYASQISSINLALIGPGIITKENIYTIYLGYIPERNQAWLGSLELLNNVSKVRSLLTFIKGGSKGVSSSIGEKITPEGSEGAFLIPPYFDIVIMNPPFARPTYRGKKTPEEKRAFFGFISSEEVREVLKDRYEKILSRITEDLRETARTFISGELKDVPLEIRDIIMGKTDEKLRQYLNIGLAGEALPFLYLAYKYVKEGGVIAFVLPRAILAGISWFLARILIASKFHLKYVIVSSDPKNGYNFSEGSDLSEVLLVAKRVERHEPSEETVFVILTKKPRTALEGVLVANSIIEAKKKGMLQFSHEGAEGIIRVINRRTLLKHVDNWNRFVAISEPILNDYIFELLTRGVITI